MTEDKKTTEKKYTVDVMIPPECLDADGAECPCYKKHDKKEQNPV